MVKKKDPHDPLLNSYSFTRLLETIKTYLDAYLEKNPSDYLVKVSLMCIQGLQTSVTEAYLVDGVSTDLAWYI